MSEPGGEVVRFGEGVEGRLFLPAATTKAGAVVILHERYGLVRHTLDLAAKLAVDGFVALAPDLFWRWDGDRDALVRGDVRVTLSDEEVGDTLDASFEYLKSHPRVDPARLAVMGVCQSGRYAVVAGARRRDLAACVVIYGAAAPAEWETHERQPRPLQELIGALSAPTFMAYGEADHTISVDDVRRARNAYEDSRKSYRLRLFGQMPHGWMNDTMPGRYRPEAAAELWAMITTFLRDSFDEGPGRGRVRWEFQSDMGVDYDFSKNVRLA